MDASDVLRAAVVQLHSGPESEENWDRIVWWTEAAARRGARLVVLPEHGLYVAPDLYRPFDEEAWAPRLAELARETQTWLLAGTVCLPADGGKVYNTSLFFDPEGRLAARYAKIHLFDVTTPDGTVYRESDECAPGRETVVAETPWGGLGLSICYDLRFPELYRRLLDGGRTRMLAVPSDFTLETGRDHWAPLLTARAIENQAFVLAAGQWGAQYEGRRSLGRSTIVDPWGTVLAQVPDGEGIAVADLDFDRQDEIRGSLPCLSHIRLGAGS